MNSAFSEWFFLQFGKRQRSVETDAELEQIASAGRAAQAELDRRHMWDQRRTAAMYGWNIPDKDRVKYARTASPFSAYAREVISASSDGSKPEPMGGASTSKD